jgi:hypothetical protein
MHYDREELISELTEIYENMNNMIRELEHLIRYLPDETMRERAKRMMLSHFQMALNDDHMWLGGNMYTLAELLEELQDPGNWDEGEEEEEEEYRESVEELPEGRFDGPTTYLITGTNLLANIGCKDTANGFVNFLQSKGIEAVIHPVGLGVAKDALAIRTEEMSAKLQGLMAEFAQSEFNPMK